MTTILDIELPSQEEVEEDPSFTPTEEKETGEPIEAESQEANEIEESSSIEDADQIPVGKVEFPLSKEIKGTRTGEAFVFESEDQKVTNINELDCNDTLDEDDHVYANEEEVEKEVQGLKKMNEGDEEEDVESDSCDSDEIDEENDEDLNNIEKAETLKCCQNLENEEDKLVKMKFKDVEELKRMKKNLESKEEEENELEGEEEEEDASMEDSSKPAEKESTASTCQTENCPKEGHATYKEEEDTDYNPIYDDTLSDIEEPEDMDNDEDVDLKAPVEVIYTNDQFCMIKDDNLMKIGADSREEMECC